MRGVVINVSNAVSSEELGRLACEQIPLEWIRFASAAHSLISEENATSVPECCGQTFRSVREIEAFMMWRGQVVLHLLTAFCATSKLPVKATSLFLNHDSRCSATLGCDGWERLPLSWKRALSLSERRSLPRMLLQTVPCRSGLRLGST